MSIAERLEASMDEASPVEMEHWKVADAGGADWALRKLAKARAELAEVEAVAEKQFAIINRFVTTETERLTPEIENWETRLALWQRELLDGDDRRKTIRLPHGTLTARKLPDGVEIADPAAVLTWARAEAPFYVRVKEELDRSAVKQAVLKGGEIIPGVTAVPGEIRFSASTDVGEVDG